jgi:hypothetical protein
VLPEVMPAQQQLLTSGSRRVGEKGSPDGADTAGVAAVASGQRWPALGAVDVHRHHGMPPGIGWRRITAAAVRMVACSAPRRASPWHR